MYEEETPTADGAQSWLNFHGWLREKVTQMSDERLRGLDDFIYGWKHHTERDPMPDYSQEEYARVFREHKNDGGMSVNVPNEECVLQLDGAGNLTILGGGGQYILVRLDNFAKAFAQLPTPGSIPDILQGPPASDVPVPGSNLMSATPPTNRQMSMSQNELTLRAIKAKRG